MIVGVIMAVVGILVILPRAGWPGVVFTLLALGAIIYHAANILLDKGVAHEVVEFDTTTSPSSAPPISQPESTEQRLKKLESLKARALITDEEYHQQRKRILDDL